MKSIDGDDAIYESQELFKLNFSHFYPETEAKTICYYCPDAVEASKSNASDYFDQFNATCQWDETLPCDYGNVYDHSQFKTSMAIEVNYCIDSSQNMNEIKRENNKEESFKCKDISI